MTDIQKLIRKNILTLHPYSSAREEYKGDEGILLDANENPFNGPYNRYPDPVQKSLKAKISVVKNCSVENIFLGNGSDEPIDLLIRAFCEPSEDNIVAMDPTYGMYQVAADINNVEYKKVLLTESFQLEADRLLNAVNKKTKLIFLCSPNNPTGNLLDREQIIKIINEFSGLVILDEAYIDFSIQPGFLVNLKTYQNLVVLQTFSKAWGMASIRLGMAFADPQIIAVLNKIKYPYNLNLLTQQFALKDLDNIERVENWIKNIISQKLILTTKLKELPVIQKVYPSNANFILVKVENPDRVYKYLLNKKIIVRNRSSVSLCIGCLRITIGSEDENKILIDALKHFNG